MAEWALVENNEITEKHDLLPESWRNVSGLNLSSDNLPFLKSLGWYPITKDTSEYDNTIYIVSGHDYTIREDDVLESNILSEINTPTFEEQKSSFMQALRNQRDLLIEQSDWTQCLDVQNLFTDEQKNIWISYRQSLRDIPEQYANNDVISLNSVAWPPKP